MNREEEEAEVRLAAAIALGKLGDQAAVDYLVQALTKEEDALRVPAARALGEIGEQAAPRLLSALRRPEETVRWGAAQALGYTGGAGVAKALRQALNDQSPQVRAAAALSLGRLRDREAVELLVQHLGDEDRTVRWCAAWALEELGAATVTYLLAAWEEGGLTAYTVALLGRIGHPQASTVLQAALRTSPARVRREAAWALSHLEGTPSLPALVEALQDPNPATRREAAWALARTGLPPAPPPSGVPEEEVSPVEREAVEALTRRAVAEALLRCTVGDEDEAVRQAAALALERIPVAPGDLVEQLIAALRHEDPQLRAQVARRLGELGDLRAATALRTALRDEDEAVRTAAEWALKQVTGQAVEKRKL